MKIAVFIALGLFAVGFLFYWVAALLRTWEKRALPGPLLCAIGLVVLFFDTLGIGCFATTTSCFKLWGLVRDEEIPGTLNVGVSIPGLAEGFIFIAIVNVDVTTLVLMIAAAVLGPGWARRQWRGGRAGRSRSAWASHCSLRLRRAWLRSFTCFRAAAICWAWQE